MKVFSNRNYSLCKNDPFQFQDYVRNSLNDPNECRDMSVEKCTRAQNLSHCHWVPGSDELGEWVMRKTWAERTNNNNKPEYVGTVANQKPRGCYPVSDANKTDQTRELTKKELNILRYKQGSEQKQKTEAEKAEARIPKKQLTDKDREKIRKRRQEMLNRLERLKAMKASKKNNAGGRKIRGGKRRRKTRRKKKSKKTTPAFANLYFTGFGVLLVYLMYRMMHKK